jgi:hypothetical protein
MPRISDIARQRLMHMILEDVGAGLVDHQIITNQRTQVDMLHTSVDNRFQTARFHLALNGTQNTI